MGLFDPSQLQNSATLFLSIVIESTPFVVLGVLVSVIIGLYVSEKLILRILPKNRLAAHALVATFGVFVPVCQCGNVPVTRRLMAQGFTPSLAVTFLMAAPIVNPITFLTTWEAFGLNHEVAVLRLLTGFAIALLMGLFISYEKDQHSLLTDEFNDYCQLEEGPHRSFRQALEIFQSEFVLIMKFLVVGAAVAAIIQTFVPKDLVLSIGQDQLTSVVAPMILGAVLSLCSTVDAFFALSLANSFMIGSILSFLVFGPLINIKMLALMRSTFKTSFLVYLSVVVGLITLVIGVLLNNMLGFAR